MSNAYLVLLRGINVGGKNTMPMAQLRSCLEDLGCENVQTFIASGNVLCSSPKTAVELAAEIEAELPRRFALDSELVRILILTREQLQRVIDQAPVGAPADDGAMGIAECGVRAGVHDRRRVAARQSRPHDAAGERARLVEQHPDLNPRLVVQVEHHVGAAAPDACRVQAAPDLG